MTVKLLTSDHLSMFTFKVFVELRFLDCNDSTVTDHIPYFTINL